VRGEDAQHDLVPVADAQLLVDVLQMEPHGAL
jgi:hypothetical protein